MKFLYIHTGNNYPPDKHLLDGLKEGGHTLRELTMKERVSDKYIHFTRSLRQCKMDRDATIVGYGLPLLVPIVRFLSRGKIIFNAVSSQYEANIISRGAGEPWSFFAYKWWFVDFISFHLSTKVLLESSAQIDFVHKIFFVPKKKLIRSWTGVDEKEFYYDTTVSKNNKFTVLFRGRFLTESGILTVIEAAKKLESDDVRFRIIGNGFMYREVNSLMEKLAPQNVERISETIPFKELREKMLACHLCLGQLADHPRLLRTLPCKLYESLALSLPYLTGRNIAVLELLKEDETCFAIEPGDPDKLAQKILFLKNNPGILQKVAIQGHELFYRELTSKNLANEVIKNCF